MKEAFKDDILEMESLGIVYRKLKETYPNQLHLNFADPRNVLTIFYYLYSQWKRRNISFVEMVKGFVKGVRRCAIFYNGHWVNQNGEIDSELIVERIEALRLEKG